MNTGAVIGVGLAVWVAQLVWMPAVEGADSAWSANADGNWSDAGNWDAGVPGSASSLSSPDVATFGLAVTGNRLIAVDVNRNIGGVTFGCTNGWAYVLSGGPLLLSNGGVIQNRADTGAHTDVIRSPVILQGSGGACTFSANTVVDGSVLRVEGDVSGVAAAGKTNTLTLTGSTLNPSENVVAGIVSDGSSGGKLSVVKSGYTNTWVLGGANTFSGGVNIQGGILIAEHSQALGSGIVTQAALGALVLRGGITVTNKTLVLGGGTPSTYGSLDSFGGTNTWAGNVTFAGVGPRLNAASGKLVITGSVYVNSSSGNPTIGGFGDGEFRGVISGVSSKTLFRSSTDTGTWYLTGTNTFAGSVTCANGTIAISNNKSLGSRTTFSATGLTLGGASTRGVLRSVADVVLTNFYGVTLHNGGGAIRTDRGTTFSLTGIVADRALGTGTLLKTGEGTLVLGAANTFSNALEVAEGTVILANADALKGLKGAKPDSRLDVDAALSLGGYAVTVPILSGAGGTISNGTLSVTASALLGGDGVLAPLAVPPTALTGTLAVDVEPDGSSDRLNVTGDLTLSNVSLAVTDPAKLDKHRVYTLAACAGGSVKGVFSSHNLPENWCVDCSGSRVQLKYFSGIFMRIQ